jgi:hypothetical protein
MSVQTNVLLADYQSDKKTAKDLNKSERTLKRWRDERRGPPWMKVGRDIFYHIPGTRDWLAAGLIKPIRPSRRSRRNT